MEGGNVREFLDSFTFQSVAVMYKGKKFFSDGIYKDINGNYRFTVDLWDNNNQYVSTVMNGIGTSVSDCISQFEEAPIWDGKTFWDAEKGMTWVDW